MKHLPLPIVLCAVLLSAALPGPVAAADCDNRPDIVGWWELDRTEMYDDTVIYPKATYVSELTAEGYEIRYADGVYTSTGEYWLECYEQAETWTFYRDTLDLLYVYVGGEPGSRTMQIMNVETWYGGIAYYFECDPVGTVPNDELSIGAVKALYR